MWNVSDVLSSWCVQRIWIKMDMRVVVIVQTGNDHTLICHTSGRFNGRLKSSLTNSEFQRLCLEKKIFSLCCSKHCFIELQANNGDADMRPVILFTQRTLCCFGLQALNGLTYSTHIKPVSNLWMATNQPFSMGTATMSEQTSVRPAINRARSHCQHTVLLG